MNAKMSLNYTLEQQLGSLFCLCFRISASSCNLQQVLPSFISAKVKVIMYSIPRPTDGFLGWSLARWTRETTDLKSQTHQIIPNYCFGYTINSFLNVLSTNLQNEFSPCLTPLLYFSPSSCRHFFLCCHICCYEATLTVSTTSLEVDLAMMSMHVRADFLNMHRICLSVCQPQQGCRRLPPPSDRALFVSFPATNGLSSPCGSRHHISQPLMAAADFTASPPAIFLMTWLSNTVTQSSKEPPPPPFSLSSVRVTMSYAFS